MKLAFSKTLCQQISTENLGMQRVAPKFVPRQLTEEQKQKGLEVNQEFLYRANNDENCLKTRHCRWGDVDLRL